MQGKLLLAVAVGGGIGAAARYELVVAFAPDTPPAFPWVTFVINLVGAFALGSLLTLVLDVWPPTRFVRPFAAIGVLGGFTTFSTLAVEAIRLLDAGQTPLSVGYLVTSLATGLVACAVGAALALSVDRVRRRRR